MIKLFTILFFLLSISAYSQPVMDGTFDGEAVWGAPKAIANDTAGWFSAQVKKFYVTSDANYLYLGAEVIASHWMAWAFIINTKAGGASSDSWARRVYYNHTNLPDFTARGHFNSYAEIYRWADTVWQRYPDIGLDSTEFGENIAGDLAEGWVEIRVPKGTLGSPSVGDIQFYITGDYNEHGSFDACPDDDNAISWTDSTTLSNYASNISLFTFKTLNLTALIEGFYNGSTMVSDTVTVELRNTSNPWGLADKDNEVLLSTAGVGTANFFSAADATNYYIVVKHRNTVETWSAAAQSFTSGVMNYNFITSQTQAFGSNMVQTASSWCFYSGDVNQDDVIDLTDVATVDVDNLNFVTGYTVTDVTGDNLVDLSDLALVDTNNLNFVGAVIPSKKLSNGKGTLIQTNN